MEDCIGKEKTVYIFKKNKDNIIKMIPLCIISVITKKKYINLREGAKTNM